MDDNLQLMNEEELKAKIILPFIEDLGLQPDEIELERSFSFKFGKARRTSARFDILCKRKGSSLFVIELKSPEIDLTSEDVEQVICYARLVHPIASFAILTNGRKTEIYDSITKKSLAGEKLGINNLNVNDEIRLRFEGLKTFIGYSKENLKIFSEAQISEGMHRLRGGPKDLKKKYLPELFISRGALIEKFERFLETTMPCFALVGEPGVGKTSCICNLAEEQAKKHFVLFYDGAELYKQISETIQDDFNWYFSAEASPSNIIKRLTHLANGSKIIIFIDAIDEINLPNNVNDLGQFLSRVSDFKEVKVCVSCKNTEWPSFIKNRGNPTRISEFTCSHSISSTAAADINSPGFFLERFSGEELTRAIAIYKKTFNLSGDFSTKLKDECRLGLILRILSETYANSRIPSDINTPELLKSYLDSKFSKGKEEQCWLYVNKLAEISLESDLVEVEENIFREKLRLGANEELLPELFDFNVLYARGEGRPRKITYYYSSVRDYLIAFHLLKLNEKNEKEFSEMLPRLMSSTIGQSCLSWAYPHLIEKIRIILLKNFESRGLIYVRKYSEVIARYFPRLRTRFAPGGEGEIGLVMADPAKDFLFAYGLRQIVPGQQLVETIPIEAGSDGFAELEQNGGVYLRKSTSNFTIDDPEELASNEIKNQIHEMLKYGYLTEVGNKYLAIEKVLAILDSYRGEFNLRKRENKTWVVSVQDLLPIDLNEILKRVHYHYAEVYVRRKLEEELRINSPSCEERIMEKTIQTNSYRIDRAKLIEDTEKLLKSGVRFPYFRVLGDIPPYGCLQNAIQEILKTSSIITESILPGPDLALDEAMQRINDYNGNQSDITNIVLSQYSNGAILEYCKKFFLHFIEEYGQLVDTCFPAHKERMKIYQLFPVRMDVRIDLVKPIGLSRIEIGFKKCGSGESHEVGVEYKNETNFLDFKTGGYSFIQIRFLYRIFHSLEGGLPLEAGINSKYANSICPLRNFVYDHIDGDLKPLL